MASADLIWSLINNHNAKLVKSKKFGGVRFSSESLNLMNLHSYKYSGLANKKAIGVEAGAERGIVLVTASKNAHQPAKYFKRTAAKKNVARANKSATSQTQHFRSDLKNELLARVSAIYRR